MRSQMSTGASELHRIISASVRDMLDAYRIQAQAGPVTDPAIEGIIFRAAYPVVGRLAPYQAGERAALLPSIVRVLLASFLEGVAGADGEIPGASHHRDDDVPRDGHAVLAGAGRGGDKGVSVKQGAYLLVTSSIFALIALLHALRLFYGWKVTMEGGTVPVWVSWGGLLMAGYLACQGFLLKRKQR
jgi:hypothetical protein